MLRYPLSFALILLNLIAWGQNRYQFEQAIYTKVFQGGDTLTNPWAGGLNYPVFNSIDLNFDGRSDLLAYDRNGFRILPFINTIQGADTFYQYRPEYIDKFPLPKTSGSFILLRDYNCDNLPDIFLGELGFVKLFTNTSSNGELSFTPYNGGQNLVTVYNAGPSSLYISSSDLPAIDDVDGDGDIDFLTFGNGGTRVEFHENVDNNCGIDLRLTDQCWGKFIESGFYRTVEMGGCLGGNKTGPSGKVMHAGSGMLNWDLNNDQVNDLLLTNVSYNNLSALYNTGTNDSVVFTSQDTMYPAPNPVDLFIFPVPFKADANFDETPDLLLSSFSNATSGSPDMASNHAGIWRYTNTGTTNQPNFVFEENDFLQKDMIDWGASSLPRLVDINGDSLVDLIVAIANRYVEPGISNSLLYYYENTGTAQVPEFTLRDTNFADIHSYNLGEEIAPAFGDLDQDGDLDMVIGTISGYFHYFKNNGTATQANYTLETPLLANTDVGADAAPELYDLDQDGDLDLFVGNERGRIYWFENQSATQPNFVLKSDFFGAVNTSMLGLTGSARPKFVRDSLGTSLFVGTFNQGIMQFDNVDTIAQLPAFISDTFGNAALNSLNSDETPFGINRRSGRNQFLIRASELQAKGYLYGFIESIGFKVTDRGGAVFSNGFTLKIKNTTATEITAFEDNFPTPYPLENFIFSFGNGWNNIPLQYPHLWDGQSNLLIEICFSGNFPADNIHISMSNTSFQSHAYGDITGFNNLSANGCNMPFQTSTNKRPDIELNITPASIPVDFSRGPRLFPGYRTGIDLADLNSDGFLDAIVGNMSGGLNLYWGEQYTVSQEEWLSNKTETEYFDLYPNPNRGRFTLRYKGSGSIGEYRVRVLDIQGRLLYNEISEGKESKLSIPGEVSSGWYILSVEHSEMSTKIPFIVR